MGKKVAIIFGGQSSEHEVSCISACTVIKNMDPKYDQVLIGITKEGKWLLVDSVSSIESGSWVKSKRTAVFSPDATRKEILVLSSERGEDGQFGRYEAIGIDVIFPVLHRHDICAAGNAPAVGVLCHIGPQFRGAARLQKHSYLFFSSS